MAILKNSKVFRGGVTSDHLSEEAAVVNGECFATGVINIRTAIASKGGGFTEVCIQVSSGDVDRLITESIGVGGLDAAERVLTCVSKGLGRVRTNVAEELESVAGTVDAGARLLEAKATAIQPEIGILKALELRDFAGNQRAVARRLRSFSERIGEPPLKGVRKAAPRRASR